MEQVDSHTALWMLDWQIDLGATEAIGDEPIDRYAIPAQAPAMVPPQVAKSKRDDTGRAPIPAPIPMVAVDAVGDAKTLAAQASSLDALQAAMAGFEHCPLKRGARSLVFCDGTPGAPVMIIGDAPGRDEDREGKPFVGRAGRLLDKMLTAVDLSRDSNVYITNVVPWRTQNSDPKPDEVAMMMPFLRRHIELAAPKLLIAVGNHACQGLLGKRGINRLRGQWDQAEGLPCLPMLHPENLLRNPAAKRDAWADMLELRAKMDTL